MGSGACGGHAGCGATAAPALGADQFNVRQHDDYGHKAKRFYADIVGNSISYRFLSQHWPQPERGIFTSRYTGGLSLFWLPLYRRTEKGETCPDSIWGNYAGNG